MKAIIDIGSTSVRLLAADKLEAVNPKTVITTKLAEGMTGGILQPTAISRTVEAVATLNAKAVVLGAENVFAYATEAVRSAKNKAEFCEATYAACGLTVRILSQQEEARFAFVGATQGANKTEAVVDMGGGSTELIVGDKSGLLFCKSVPLGVVRLKNLVDEGKNVKEYIDVQLKNFGSPPYFDKLYAVGGTACTIAAILKRLDPYDPLKTHGTVVSIEDVKALYLKLKNLPEQKLLNLAGLPRPRANLIANGVLSYIKLLQFLNHDSFTVSEADGMDGLFLSL